MLATKYIIVQSSFYFRNVPQYQGSLTSIGNSYYAKVYYIVRSMSRLFSCK